jgi:hypothetical protein
MTSLLVQHAALIVTMDDADTRWLPTGRALLLASRSDKISSTRSGAQARTWIGMKNSVVLIVGAGPTGLALACDLRTRGIDVLVVDKAAGPATTSRALGLQARGREILARLGALGDLPERAIHGRARDTSRAWDLFLGRTLFDRLFRDLLFFTLMRVPAFQRRWVDSGSQLRVSYRGGPLARTVRNSGLHLIFRRGPVAGDRGPDASCRLVPAGTPTTLGEQARALWTLLFFGGPEPNQRSCAHAARHLLGDDLRVFSIRRRFGNRKTSGDGTAPNAILDDHLGDLARAYRANKSTTILLRPDGHVGWRSSRPDMRSLVAWLRAALNGETDEEGQASQGF